MQVVFPRSESEIIEVVKACVQRGGKIRVVGAQKSHPPMLAAPDVAISMEKMTGVVAIDTRSATVTVRSGTKIEDLCAQLWENGFTIHGLGSVNGQSIGGNVATGTHSQGLEYSSVASYVVGMRMVDGKGQLHVLKKQDDPDGFKGLPIAFGSLGIVTELTISIFPRYFVNLGVEVFDYRKKPQRLLQLVLNTPTLVRLRPELQLAEAISYTPCPHNPEMTEQMRCIDTYFLNPKIYNAHIEIGVVRKFWLRARRELMRVEMKLLGRPRIAKVNRYMEYAFSFDRAQAVIDLLEPYYRTNYPNLRGSIGIRATQADELWLSPCQGAPMCYIACYTHCVYNGLKYYDHIEAIMLRHGGRTHWGKEFTAELPDFQRLYPRWHDFKELRKVMDPDGIFENDWVKTVMAE